MERDLKKYIEEQKKAGVNPGALRYNLLRSGWPKEKIDDEIAKSYTGGRPSALSVKLVILLLIVIAALAAILIYLATKPTGPGTNPGGPQVPEEENPCISIAKSEAKDVCYQQLVADGFDCGSLEDEYENAFCFRALDYYLTSR